jgi:hypothetical protein
VGALGVGQVVEQRGLESREAVACATEALGAGRRELPLRGAAVDAAGLSLDESVAEEPGEGLVGGLSLHVECAGDARGGDARLAGEVCEELLLHRREAVTVEGFVDELAGHGARAEEFEQQLATAGGLEGEQGADFVGRQHAVSVPRVADIQWALRERWWGRGCAHRRAPPAPRRAAKVRTCPRRGPRGAGGSPENVSRAALLWRPPPPPARCTHR